MSQPRIREFWSHRGPLNFLLLPLSAIYWLILRIRLRILIRQQRPLKVPVIIAGAITAGGGGKTTLVQALAKGLRQRGRCPGIITRGYGGSATTGTCLAGNDPDPAMIGDEAAMLARILKAPVAAGANRLLAAEKLLESHPEVDVLISDDGLQHLRLPRQFELVTLSSYGLGNGWLLPAGPLREPPGRMRDVDAVIEKSASASSDRQSIEFGPVQLLDASENVIGLEQLAGKQVCVLAGIADPGEFFAEVKAAGISAAKQLAFADHHRYTAAQLDSIDADFLVMTAKDAIKCRRLGDPRIVELRRDPALSSVLLDRILDRLSRFQPA